MKKRKSELVDLYLIIVRDEKTDGAILVKEHETADKIWLPRSLVEIDYADCSPGIAKVTMTEWLATEKGLV